MFNNEIKINNIKNRINILRNRNPVTNANIIRKLERNVRNLENNA